MLDFLNKYPAKRKIAAILVIITLIGAGLRLYKFEELVRFNNDQVRDSKIVDKMIEKKDFPLLGPEAGSTDFKIGPAFYYLEYISALIFGNTPPGIAFLVAILSIASIPLFFYYLRFYFPVEISLLLTFAYSISFYAIKYSKFTWNPNVIPFFFIAFLILLLKIAKEYDRETFWLYFWSGIVIGIGIQLHTMLMILMPLLFVFVCFYIYPKTKKKKRIVYGFLLASLLIVILNSAYLAYDIKNNGKNLKSFFQVTEEKAEKKIALTERFLSTNIFFVKNNVYILSAFEPTKNWLEIKKFLSRKNAIEVISAFLGTTFFIFTFLRMILLFKRERDENKKIYLKLIFGTILISYLIFFFVTDMLKARFFIIIFFLPFICLGFLADAIKHYFKKNTAYAALLLIAIFLVFFNLKVYSNAYDIKNYSEKESLYGGISFGETLDISRYITDSSKKDFLKNKKYYLSNFQYYQSVNYLNKKTGLEISPFSKKVLEDQEILFMVGKNKNKKRILENNEESYILTDSKNIGRFTIFIFQNKQ